MPRIVSLVLFLMLATVASSARIPGDAECTPLGVALESVGFESIFERAGVNVYRHHDPKQVRIAAEAILDTSADLFMKALLDYRRHPGNINRVSTIDILGCGHNKLLLYQHLNLPVIDDRDFVLLVKWGETDGVRWVRYQSKPELGPCERPGIVRVSHNRGSWQMRSLDDGRRVQVRYQFSIDMAGMLPLWMARSHAGRELPELFSQLLELTEISKNEKVECYSPDHAPVRASLKR